MDEDPLNRPTAEVALKIVVLCEQQYLNQCQQTSSRKPKARREKSKHETIVRAYLTKNCFIVKSNNNYSLNLVHEK